MPFGTELLPGICALSGSSVISDVSIHRKQPDQNILCFCSKSHVDILDSKAISFRRPFASWNMLMKSQEVKRCFASAT
jgi:hypothetical protein